ncbi:MAG: hypothetical protein RLZZ180_1675 [Pseudomonadota bacterium]
MPSRHGPWIASFLAMTGGGAMAHCSAITRPNANPSLRRGHTPTRHCDETTRQLVIARRAAPWQSVPSRNGPWIASFLAMTGGGAMAHCSAITRPNANPPLRRGQTPSRHCDETTRQLVIARRAAPWQSMPSSQPHHRRAHCPTHSLSASCTPTPRAAGRPSTSAAALRAARGSLRSSGFAPFCLLSFSPLAPSTRGVCR